MTDFMNLSMRQYLQPASQGKFSLEHFTVDFDMTDDKRDEFNVPPNGDYVRLKINGEVYMSDTPMEKETNTDFVNSAFGDVFIGGLGLGMVLMAIQDKPEVNSITVVELHKEIISIVGKQLPLNNKVKIVQADLFRYTPVKKFDIIYLDIWPSVSRRIYEKEMLPLMKYYRKYLKPTKKNKKRRIFCWAEDAAKADTLTPEYIDDILKLQKAMGFTNFLVDTQQQDKF